MLRHVFAFLCVVCVFILAPFAIVRVGLAHADDQRTVRVRVPVCAEDAPYLRGRGDFNGTRWERYVCVHQDRVQR